MRSGKWPSALIVGSFLWLLGMPACTPGNSAGDDTTNADYASSLSFIGQAIALDASLLAQENNFLDSTDCSSQTFSSCVGTGTKTLDFSPSGGDSAGCTYGVSGSAITVFGEVSLSFSDPSCGISVLGQSVNRKLTNFYTQDLSSRKLLAYTTTGTVAGKTFSTPDLEDYAGNTYSGGTTLTKIGGGYSVVLNGIHRRSLSSAGNLGYWHTLYTDTSSPLSALGSSGTFRINSGSYNISQNLAKVKVVHSLFNLQFSPTCCYPVGGTSTLTVGSQSPINLTWTSTCGSLTMDGVAVTLPACGS